jgi:hypothetical protein
LVVYDVLAELVAHCGTEAAATVEHLPFDAHNSGVQISVFWISIVVSGAVYRYTEREYAEDNRSRYLYDNAKRVKLMF